MNDRLLRDVRLLDGYRLRTFDTNKKEPGTYGHSYLAYIFQAPGGRVLFKGADYGVSAFTPIDADETLVSLLGFLTLKPGDTDQEYFAKYTPEQLDWCQSSDAEELALLVYDYENRGAEHRATPFKDWP